MTTKNNELIGKGLEILRKALAPYVKRQLKASYKEKWWGLGADPHVGRMTELKVKLSKAKDDDARFDMLEFHNAIKVVVKFDNKTISNISCCSHK